MEILFIQGKRKMSNWSEDPNVQLAVGLVMLCILITAGFSLVSRFRDYAAQDQDDTVDALANLEEMHRKGDISEEEFRTIKSKASLPSQNDKPDDGSTSQDESSSPSYSA